jgi:hypothetical protein
MDVVASCSCYCTRVYASPSLLRHRVEQEEEGRTHTHTHTEKRAAQNIPPAVSNEGPKFVRARYLSLQHRMVKFEHEAQALRAS